MNLSDESELRPDTGRKADTYPILIVATSLAALVGTFLLADSSMEVGSKTVGFSGILASFLAICVLFYFFQQRREHDNAATAVENDEIGRHLNALEDANEFFAGVLKPADTFRLVASRVKALLHYQTIQLLLLDETRTHLIVAEAGGTRAGGRKGLVLDFDSGLAGRSLCSTTIEFGNEAFGPGENESPSVTIPLRNGMRVFGILQVYFDPSYRLDAADISTYEAIGVRVAPLMLSSIAFEKSQTNALTDVTTDLPNERAFYLVLENQIAEATRKGGDRPLTILTIDVKGFDDINRRFGHASGDRVLNFVAQTVRDNLRQMDFFARSIGDEFLAILPTASKEDSHEVIARVQTGFFGRKIKLTETEMVEIDINIGWAAFGVDGETADQLLGAARLRKGQSKSGVSNKVLWFSKELIN